MNWLKRLLNKETEQNRPAWWRQYEATMASAPPPNTPMGVIRFVVFDTESTGLHPQKDRILSVGAVGVLDHNIVIEDRFECYLKQTYQAKEEAVAVHGILPGERNNMLEETEALEAFFHFTGSAVLIGHHLDFDLSILNAALFRAGLPKLKNRTIDTSRLASRLQPPSSGIILPGDYSLDTLCKQYHIPMDDRHTAAGDAFMTAQLFLKLCARLQKRGNRTLGDLIK